MRSPILKRLTAGQRLSRGPGVSGTKIESLELGEARREQVQPRQHRVRNVALEQSQSRIIYTTTSHAAPRLQNWVRHSGDKSRHDNAVGFAFLAVEPGAKSTKSWIACICIPSLASLLILFNYTITSSSTARPVLSCSNI